MPCSRAGVRIGAALAAFATPSVMGALLALSASAAPAAQDSPEGLPVRSVEVVGLETISEGFVRRIIRTRAGQNYSRRQAQEDVRELLRTRKFLNVFEVSRVEDGQVAVVFTFQEKPEVVAIEIEGNKRFTTDELLKELTIAPGTPLDRYEVSRSQENIARRYREKGYYYVEVTVDEGLLAAEGRVLYRVVEGPRVRIRKIVLEGVRSLTEPELLFRIRSQTYFPIFRTGAFDEEQAERDAADLQTHYRNQGFLEARVAYRLDFDQVDRGNLTLVFVIEEGARYRIREIRFRGNEVFDERALSGAMTLAPDDIAREEAVVENVRRLTDLYGEIGYVEAHVETSYEFFEEPGLVDLIVAIAENERSRFGRITVRGNARTRDEVVRRELRFFPGEDYNTVKARKAEQRLTETGLFSKATITPLEDVDGVREALVEVVEADTTQILFGFGVSSDSGAFGSLTVENRNFDLFDWPRTFGEILTSWRGAGQRLRLSFEPGTEVTRFRVDFTEPYLLGNPLRLDLSAYLFQRSRGAYDEGRIGFIPSLSHRFESGLLEGFAVEGALRFELIDIGDVNPLAASDIRKVRGDSTLTSVKGSIVRDTTDSRLVPTEGYRVSLSWEQAGAIGGDYTFSKPAVGAVWYRTLSTDVFDRKSVLALRADAAWIFGDAPVFERFYGGGFGSIRGFRYRGISPRKGIFKDRVGGDFIVLTGAEYSFPIYAKNVRGVTFLDMGTVEEGFTITGWRASVGFGLRINVDFFGPIPIVLDFGFPVLREDQDDDQIFNFSFGASF